MNLFFRRGGRNAFTPFVGAFGKVPRAGDFVRVGLPHAATAGLEHWLIAAVGWLEGRALPPSPEQRQASPIIGFFYRPRPRAGALLAGVLRWSHDAVGRSFPFAVFAALSDETLGTSPQLLPLACRPFIEHLATTLGVVSNVGSAQELQSALASLSPPDLDGGHAGPYAGWAAQSRLSDVWASLYGSPDGEAPRVAVHTLAEALAPFRRSDEPGTQLAALLPLDGDWALGAAFWIDVARRVGGWKTNTPTCFFSLTSPARLLLALGDPHASALAEVTLGQGDQDQVCDLMSARTPTFGYQALPANVESVLANPSSLVSDLLPALSF